jgi:hypothetical protein
MCVGMEALGNHVQQFVSGASILGKLTVSMGGAVNLWPRDTVHGNRSCLPGGTLLGFTAIVYTTPRYHHSLV